jgi:RNA polymerase sigma factor (sigma-70 family)
MTTKTDRELLAAWRETGDESAFAELVARHRQMVYRTSLRMLGSVQDTEDAVQAVFVVLAQKADRLQREGSLGGWLHTVTRHVAMQALTRRASHARREKEFAMWPEADIETSSPDVDTSAVLRCLDQELAGLSAVLRQAVVLRYLQGNSEKAAAELAGCPLGTLSRRASQGLAKLRQRLAKRGVVLSGVALAGLLTSEASAAVPETLLPSILATVKTVAAGAATTTATSTAAMLAKGAMKAMFITKVKLVAAVAAAILVVVGGGAIVAQEVAAQREATTQQVSAEKNETKPEPMKPALTSAPMIENMQIELVYPLDTRKKPQEIKGIQDRITAMAGTRVNLGFVFTQPLKSAVLTFDDQTRMPLDVVGRFASVSFVHSQARRAKLQVEDVNGLALEKPHAMEFGFMAGEAHAATSSNIVVRIVAADAPDRLVSELEAIKSVAVSNRNSDASSDQSASSLGSDTTLWARGARVDGTNTFERSYKGVFTGRKSELPFARGTLKEGEHVIDPGRHVFHIDKDGKLSSTDPDIVIEGSTVNLKAYRIEFMCVDGNKPGAPETRLLGRPLHVDELRPGFDPAAAKFDASNAVNTLSHYRRFCPLRLYLPANTNELAYALRPGVQRFRILPGGTVELQGKTIPTIKAEGPRIVVSYGVAAEPPVAANEADKGEIRKKTSETNFTVRVKLQKFSSPDGMPVDLQIVPIDPVKMKELVAGDVRFVDWIALPAEEKAEKEVRIDKGVAKICVCVGKEEEGNIDVTVSITHETSSSRSTGNSNVKCRIGEEVRLGWDSVVRDSEVILYTLLVMKDK